MKVLVVHDREGVAQEICEVLTSLGVPKERQTVVGDYNSARAALSSELFDLLIVDLTLPLSKEFGQPSYELAGELLRELFVSDTLNTPGDIIGITKDADALDRIDNALGRHLMVIIPEDASGKWKTLLFDKVDYTKRSVQARVLSAYRQYDYDALVLTAMDEEFKPYLAHFEFCDVKQFDGAKEFVFYDRDNVARRGIAYPIGKSGQPAAASTAQALLLAFRPRLAVMTGYCGGVKGKVQLGDLLFFESTYAWDYGKWEEISEPPFSQFLSRPNPIGIENGLLHKICRDYMNSDFNRQPSLLDSIEEKSHGKLKSFSMVMKPVGSGSAVVANDAIVSQIRNLNDSIWGVDMESYGFYYAAKNTPVVKPEFLCIKAVSDFCNGEKGDDYHKVCSYISATVAIDLLERRWRFSPQGRTDTEE